MNRIRTSLMLAFVVIFLSTVSTFAGVIPTMGIAPTPLPPPAPESSAASNQGQTSDSEDGNQSILTDVTDYLTNLFG